MANTSHLVALQIALAHERERLARATSRTEIALRTVWIAQRERELSGELAFLGMDDSPIVAMSDSDLLAALLA